MLLPSALSAGSFEGKVTMTISSSGSKDAPQTMNYSIKEGYLRVDMAAMKGGGAFITDFKKREMIIIMDQQKMYMVKDLPDPASYQKPAGSRPMAAPASTPSDVSFKDTGQKETIAGYECEKYEVTSPRGTTDIWATDQLGMFGGLNMGGGMGHRSAAPSAWESVIKGSGFFPMRVVSNDGGKKFKLEVTQVDRESLPDSLFAPPDGYRKFDLGAMMSGAFQGH
jgi:hypothetical protein